MLTLGSLFDGIGVFPLAARLNGIEPVWASEIMKAPVSITKRHFPGMTHLGDITLLDGREIPPVDIITFGSPCQNLSQIGDRTGLAGKKSSLFFEAIRIINEMRDATDNIYPTIIIFENVMGLLSSGNRLDFGAVLSAFAGVEIPMPDSGLWANAGLVRGRRPDIAWRLMDAQHWARPPLARRQRVFIVADFGGRRAAEILFKPRPMQQFFAAGSPGGSPAAPGNRGPFLEAGGRVPIVHSFQIFRMRGAARAQNHVQFTGSFGRPNDPFSTLLASKKSPFAIYFADNPTDGCVRNLTELECERLMGLPEGWTKYGAQGEEIRPAQRYRALGNSIALPCAAYILAGVGEALGGNRAQVGTNKQK